MLIKNALRRIAAALPEKRVLVRRHGIAMDLLTSHSIDFKIIFNAFEPNTIEFIKNNLRPGEVAVDVGANIGFLSLIMAKQVGPSGVVLSFEPSDWTFQRLEANIALNAVDWILASRAAVGAKDEHQVNLTLPRGYRLDGRFTQSSQLVPMICLDTALKDIKMVNFIKTDTDGHELEVLLGAMKTIKRCRPIILFEVASHCYKKEPNKLLRVIGELSSIGYRFSDDNGVPLRNPFDAIDSIPYRKSINLAAFGK